jgi:hypothetical protein
MKKPRPKEEPKYWNWETITTLPGADDFEWFDKPKPLTHRAFVNGEPKRRTRPTERRKPK